MGSGVDSSSNSSSLLADAALRFRPLPLALLLPFSACNTAWLNLENDNDTKNVGMTRKSQSQTHRYDVHKVRNVLQSVCGFWDSLEVPAMTTEGRRHCFLLPGGGALLAPMLLRT